MYCGLKSQGNATPLFAQPVAEIVQRGLSGPQRIETQLFMQ
jgi:hypothetical protein